MNLDRDIPRRACDAGAQDESRHCDHPECAQAGLYRAPKAPDRLNEHYWFCLEHVRDYNAAWNYCEGLSEDEVEARVRSDTVWHRPTWPMGRRRSIEEERLYAEAMAFAGMGQAGMGEAGMGEAGAGRFRTGARDTRGQKGGEPASGKSGKERRALAALNLKAPVTFEEIRARYIELVKRLHPDSNGGNRSTEDRLKTINRAYALLREKLG